jgi:glycosyltransferase involved in cell wall biosynthesis
LTVFFPAYDDGDSIGPLVAETFQVLEQYVSDHEVIVVNDGSSDHTGEVLRRLQNEYGSHRFRIVTHPRNRGYGAALRSGFSAATKEFVFYTDGDGQYDVGQLPLLLAQAARGAEWVNGFKANRSDAAHRKWIGGLYNRVARRLFRIQLRDIDCDFRLIRRSLLNPGKLRSTSGTICIEIARQLEHKGVRATEVAVNHLPRRHGSSRFFRPLPLIKTAWQIGFLYLRSRLVEPAA